MVEKSNSEQLSQVQYPELESMMKSLQLKEKSTEESIEPKKHFFKWQIYCNKETQVDAEYVISKGITKCIQEGLVSPTDRFKLFILKSITWRALRLQFMCKNKIRFCQIMRDVCEEHCKEHLQTQQPKSVKLYSKSTASIDSSFCGTFQQALEQFNFKAFEVNEKVEINEQKEPQERV